MEAIFRPLSDLDGTQRVCGLFSPISHRIYTPYTHPVGGDEKKIKTVQSGQFSMIYKGQQSLEFINHPMGKRHKSGGKESGPNSE